MEGGKFLFFVYTVGFGMVLGAAGVRISDGRFNHMFPATEKVQQGYVVPSKLEIMIGDLDGNGEPETIMKYNGQSYLLRLDERGKPKVQAYEIKPAEVVPKSE